MRTQLTNHGANICSHLDCPARITHYQGEHPACAASPAFQLPPPPPGMRWHREDGWKEGDLPSGYRPLVAGEIRLVGDSLFPTDGGDTWRDKWQTVEDHWTHPQNPAGQGSYKSRTTRPLTFEHAGKTWTWHRPGDPMPCDEEREVVTLLEDLDIGGTIRAGRFDWSQRDDGEQIIGWRYADEKKTVPLGPDDVPPGSVLRSDSWTYGGHVTPSVFLGVVCWANTSGNVYLTYEQLAKQGWQINRPRNRDADGNPTKWEPCSKEVPA